MKRFPILLCALIILFSILGLWTLQSTAQQPTIETERLYAGYQVPARAGDVIYTGAYHNYLLSPIRWTDTTHFALFIAGVEVNGIYPAFLNQHDVVVCARQELQAGEYLFEVVAFHNDCFR